MSLCRQTLVQRVSRFGGFPVALLAVTLHAASVLAQGNYPTKAITLIVPSAAGGFTDPLYRLFGERLRERTGQLLQLDYRPGAVNTIGYSACAKAAPDGHTLCFASASFTTNPALYTGIPYQQTDFQPIVQFLLIPLVLTVPNSLPAKNMQEFIAYAKTRKDAINVAFIGSMPKLRWFQISQMTGVQFVDVPFKGTSDALAAVINGAVDGQWSTIDVGANMGRSGKLKVIAVGSQRRMPYFPDVAAVSETLPGVEVGGWGGLIGQAAMPRAVVDWLNREMREFVKTPEAAKTMEAGYMVPASTTPEEFGAIIRNETALYARLAKEAGIKLQPIQ